MSANTPPRDSFAGVWLELCDLCLAMEEECECEVDDTWYGLYWTDLIDGD